MVEKRVRTILFLLIGEKIIQHVYTALILIISNQRLGIIDMTYYKGLSETSLALGNILLVFLFVIVLGYYKNKQQFLYTILYAVALFDIIAEFVFHGFFFITFSVIFAAVLLLVAKRHKSLVAKQVI